MQVFSCVHDGSDVLPVILSLFLDLAPKPAEREGSLELSVVTRISPFLPCVRDSSAVTADVLTHLEFHKRRI